MIIKAAGGGGGRGMRVVHTEAALLNAVSMTRSEAQAALQIRTVYLERYLEQPRHIEIQVLADAHKNAVCIWASATARCSGATRRCSRSRLPRAAAKLRDRIGERCVDACRRIGYRGTFEFLTRTASFISSR